MFKFKLKYNSIYYHHLFPVFSKTSSRLTDLRKSLYSSKYSSNCSDSLKFSSPTLISWTFVTIFRNSNWSFSNYFLSNALSMVHVLANPLGLSTFLPSNRQTSWVNFWKGKTANKLANFKTLLSSFIFGISIK